MTGRLLASDGRIAERRADSGKHKRTTFVASTLLAAGSAFGVGSLMQGSGTAASFDSVEPAHITAEIVTTTPLEQVEFTSVPTTGIPNLEVSLVIDLSETDERGRKLAQVKRTATEFVERVLGPARSGDGTSGEHGNVSVSLVPYAGHVNLGADLFAALGDVRQRHRFSYCVDLPDSAFLTASLPRQEIMEQMQHVTWDTSGLMGPDRTACPRYSYEEVTPFSVDADRLTAQIAQFQPHAGAAVFQGVKWGAALLDPSSRGILDTLARRGAIDATFAGRPAAHDDSTTHKAIVLISDGRNDDSLRVADWAYNSPSEYVHWARNSFWPYLERAVQTEDHGDYFELRYSSREADALTLRACDAAKEQGIEIWAMVVGETGAGTGLLTDCASSPEHVVFAQPADIDGAVDVIAARMRNSHLLQ